MLLCCACRYEFPVGFEVDMVGNYSVQITCTKKAENKTKYLNASHDKLIATNGNYVSSSSYGCIMFQLSLFVEGKNSVV